MEDLKYNDKMADVVFEKENGGKETAVDSALYFADGASCSGSTDEDSAYDSAAMSVDNDCDETASNKSVGSGKSSVGSEVKTYPDDCPVVSANNAVAYYDVLTPGPRGRSPKKPRVTCPSYYQVDMSETHYQSQYDQMNSSYPGEQLTAKMEGLTLGATVPAPGNNNTAVVANNNNDDGLAIGAQRLAVLSYEQVRRLSDVMDDVVSIHGRGNFPTLDVRLRDLVTAVRAKLELPATEGGAGMKVRDIRLNGGAASHVLATESQPYNDLDLIFAVEFSSGRHYDRVKSAVLASLCDLLPEGAARKRVSTCGIKEAYVSKMVKVNNDGDRWSLISLGNSRGHKNVELKFVDTMRRQFEFSVDSFQIVLDSLFLFSDCAELPISENFYPTVVGESVYGDFREALYHLHKKLICTRHPEEIRGGGLLKYCNLLVKSYRAARPDRIKTLERYMCSRFFIDFPDITQQRAKLGSYLWNHFAGPEEETLKYHFLMLLHSVVEESTVCLMGHERRQTLALIENLACEELCHERQRLLAAAPQPALLYANGYYYAPIMPACYPCSCPAPWMACST